jgi:hypothetical protein
VVDALGLLEDLQAPALAAVQLGEIDIVVFHRTSPRRARSAEVTVSCGTDKTG